MISSPPLKPNVQDLQKDVIDLLERISSLMHSANTAVSSDSGSNKYREFQQEVAGEADKVKNLELRMAIVAPMKAGKSTIINAIIGQDILPSRNAAMTTLPTEIVFDAELAEPTLTLSSEILSVFQEAHLALQSKIQALDAERMQEKIAQYPHLVNLIQEIRDTVGFPTRARTNGGEEIIKTLTGLNDIIRLCSLIEPSKDPLGQLIDVPCIRTPFWQLQNTSHSEMLGNFVIVDTPGPNEAGENLRLTAVVTEQLRRSSIVLIVLDFTQLKTKASEEVKKEVQKVIQLRGKENLYVLVNKVDQRTDGDMTSEQVQQFVAAEFGIGDPGDKDRVFEISARRAFYATNFCLELRQYKDVDITQMKTARALAKQAFGDMWEIIFKSASVDQMQLASQHIWEKSGFAPFLEKAINALMKSAAPRCMKSALNFSRSCLVELIDDVKLRSSAILQDAEKLQQEVGALEADLTRLELCRKKLKEANRVKTQLHQKLNKILNDLKNKAKVTLETFLSEEEYQSASFLNKRGIEARNLVNWWAKQLRLPELKGNNLFEFDSFTKAEEFVDKAMAYGRQRIDNLLEDARENTKKQIEEARKDLIEQLDIETKPIIEKARQRLNQAFNVELSLPSPLVETNDLEIARPSVKSAHRYEDQGYEEKEVEKRAFWHWLWIVPYKEIETIKRPDKRVDYYTISLEELVKQINCFIETSINNINQEVNKYLDEDLQQRFDAYFENLDCYLCNYRDNLQQAQEDQKLAQEQKEKLKVELSSLNLEAIAQIKQADKYLACIDNDLMPGK